MLVIIVSALSLPFSALLCDTGVKTLLSSFSGLPCQLASVWILPVGCPFGRYEEERRDILLFPVPGSTPSSRRRKLQLQTPASLGLLSISHSVHLLSPPWKSSTRHMWAPLLSSGPGSPSSSFCSPALRWWLV